MNPRLSEFLRAVIQPRFEGRDSRRHLNLAPSLCALVAVLFTGVTAFSQEPAADKKPPLPVVDKASNPLAWASNQTLVARSLAERGQYTESKSLFREIISLYTEKLGAEHTNTLTSRHGLSLVLFYEGQYDESYAETRAVLKLRERILGPEHPDTLKSRDGVARVLSAKGQYEEAEKEFREVLRIQERVVGRDHPNTLLYRNNLAVALYRQRKFGEAESEYRAVLKVREQLGTQDLDTLRSLYNLASFLDEQGKLEEAHPFARRAAEGARKVLGSEHPNTEAYTKFYDRLTSDLQSTNTLYERSDAAFERKEYQQAERLALASAVLAKKNQPVVNTNVYRGLHMAGHCALELRNAVSALSHFTNAALFLDKAADPREWAHNVSDQARAFEADLQFAQAEGLVRQVVAMRTKELGPEDPVTLAARGRLPYLLFQQGKHAEAETESRELIPLQQRVLGAEDRETLNSRMVSAQLSQARGKYSQAEAEFRGLLKVLERKFGPEHPDTLGAVGYLAFCLNKLGRAEEGREYARRAAEGFRKVLGAEHPYTIKAEALYKLFSTKK